MEVALTHVLRGTPFSLSATFEEWSETGTTCRGRVTTTCINVAQSNVEWQPGRVDYGSTLHGVK